jgi:N-acetylneuraminic acid mutarotase
VALAAGVAATPVLAAGSWSVAGSLQLGRGAFAAATLSDGTVLVAGGAPGGLVGNTAERYDPGTDTWSRTGNLAVARVGATLSPLAGGQALVVGGQAGAGFLRSTERFDPVTATWSAAAPLSTPRANHTATVLGDGRVLVVGGTTSSGGATNEVEIYDPAAGTWMRADPLRNPRYNHAATLLADGRVLVTGGFTPGAFHTATRKAEVYDPASDEWSFTGSMQQPRAVHAAALLADGRVLVAGGVTSPPNALVVTATSELWDPATDTWTSTGALLVPRRAVDAERLADGTVLVAGGYTPGGAATATTELFDVAAGAWVAAPSMGVPRAPLLATLLDGRVLAIGSVGRELLTTVEAYAP